MEYNYKYNSTRTYSISLGNRMIGWCIGFTFGHESFRSLDLTIDFLRVTYPSEFELWQSINLWTYAPTFSCIARFIVIVLNNFQEQLVLYVTPTDAIEKCSANPSKSKIRVGGLVFEGSVVQPSSSPEMEFVVTGSTKSVSEKARSGEYYFAATEVLTKHDEKYVPGEVAAAIEKNKKKLEEASAVEGEAAKDDKEDKE